MGLRVRTSSFLNGHKNGQSPQKCTKKSPGQKHAMLFCESIAYQGMINATTFGYIFEEQDPLVHVKMKQLHIR